MCGLCGVLGAEDHWTDTGSNPAAFSGRATERPRRQERLRRVALANRILAHYRMRVSDWQGSRYVLTNSTGRSQIVDHLGALWPAAAALTDRPCDPLDPDLIADLTRLR